ncbi:MAG: YdeI/OmpD-associated family protein [Cyanobacteria bacterium P01_C01_bin.147]
MHSAIPADLEAEFDKHPDSRELFERFLTASRRGILEWLKTAQTSPTRQKRILETTLKAAQNIKANHPKGRDAGLKDRNSQPQTQNQQRYKHGQA